MSKPYDIGIGRTVFPSGGPVSIDNDILRKVLNKEIKIERPYPDTVTKVTTVYIYWFVEEYCTWYVCNGTITSDLNKSIEYAKDVSPDCVVVLLDMPSMFYVNLTQEGILRLL